MTPLDQAKRILVSAIDTVHPTHIVSMVSGGKDSACSHAVAVELLSGMGRRIDLVIHGNTRCGIQETSEFVAKTYGHGPHDFAIADAGTAYEDYVMRKGFFGRGITGHAFAYRILKAAPFRRTISAKIRNRRRNIRILLLNGARRDESENRAKTLRWLRPDPAARGNVWTSHLYDWSAEQRDAYLAERSIPINPVAVQLCRSGECMCGTMQSRQERAEAAALYPKWGAWLDELEAESFRVHGLRWGESSSERRDLSQLDLFQPMCSDCGAEKRNV
ncbi:MAG: phosphoadenosine phosphosulfate reductase family protein [Henriciella sp.]|nr:phosphoadenosine phosphosulfate reductase family protein [Henriciella sp.]